jgi:Na+-driven multidrug efflux pump
MGISLSYLPSLISFIMVVACVSSYTVASQIGAKFRKKVPKRTNWIIWFVLLAGVALLLSLQ